MKAELNEIYFGKKQKFLSTMIFAVQHSNTHFLIPSNITPIFSSHYFMTLKYTFSHSFLFPFPSTKHKINASLEHETHLLFLNELYDYALGKIESMPNSLMNIINDPKISKDCKETMDLLKEMANRNPENDKNVVMTEEEIRNDPELEQLDR